MKPGRCDLCAAPLDDHDWYLIGVGRWLDWPTACPPSKGSN